MSTEAPGQSPPEPISIRNEEFWRNPPTVSFDQKASLSIATTVLWMFGGVYLLCFIMAFIMFRLEGANYEKAVELVKFLLQAILPLVTLAVGYYLGDRARSQSSSQPEQEQ